MRDACGMHPSESARDRGKHCDRLTRIERAPHPEQAGEVSPGQPLEDEAGAPRVGADVPQRDHVITRSAGNGLEFAGDLVRSRSRVESLDDDRLAISFAVVRAVTRARVEGEQGIGTISPREDTENTVPGGVRHPSIVATRTGPDVPNRRSVCSGRTVPTGEDRAEFRLDARP